jgi:hypothetical protein
MSRVNQEDGKEIYLMFLLHAVSNFLNFFFHSKNLKNFYPCADRAGISLNLYSETGDILRTFSIMQLKT